MPKKPPKSWEILVVCDKCQRKAKSALLPGSNYITGICECGAKWQVSAEVDSEGNATVYSGNIEQQTIDKV